MENIIYILGQKVGSEVEARFVLLRALFTHGSVFTWDDRDQSTLRAGEALEKLGLVEFYRRDGFGAATITLTPEGFTCAALIAAIASDPVVVVEDVSA